MDLNLNVLSLASGLAAHASARQQVIAENVAHADTPGYRARDIADFAATLERGPGVRRADDPARAYRRSAPTRAASSRARRRRSGRRRRTATRSRSRTR